MSFVQTVDRYVRFPTALASGSYLYRERPLGSGRAGLLGSNAVYLGRANARRPLGEHDGFGTVTDPIYGGLPVAASIESFAWAGGPLGTGGTYCHDFGLQRVELVGDTGIPTKIVLRCRAQAFAGRETGVILSVTRGLEWPGGGIMRWASTTSTSLADLTCTVDLVSFAQTREAVVLASPGDGSVAVEPVGTVHWIGLWIAAWGTGVSNGEPGYVRGITLSAE